MGFPPIAIVGEAAVLPGALGPDELWLAVLEGRDLLSRVPEGRWRMDPGRALGGSPEDFRDRTWSDRGGYVDGFERVFDPRGFAVPPEEILGLDPLFHWVLHTAREALRSAGIDPPLGGSRAGLVMGNLSFPSSALSRFAEAAWLETRAPPALRQRAAGRLSFPDPRNRFMSGYPAHLAARALGLAGRAFALDAACASSLYAIKLACDRLHDGAADLMLAGAVNRADDLFIHVGFCALMAMSRSGRSRPFHREADGLVPAEGAAFVALKRLDDAERDRDRILGVIRGVGLSNDGRGAGFLAPSEAGQRRAMESAYAVAGLHPRDVSLVECHATGTAVGDAAEVRSMAEVFRGASGLPIGSLKSNLGHAITVAGAAGLLKVLHAFEAGLLPPTLHAEAPIDALASSPFRLIAAPERWTAAGPRRAAVSAFGFGGNNAHLIVEQWEGPRAPRVAVAAAPPGRAEIAIVGLGAVVAGGGNAGEFARVLFTAESRVRPRDDGGAAGFVGEVTFDPQELRFPPRDLEQTLPQQLLMLRAAEDAARDAGALSPDRTSVLIGIETDSRVARSGIRVRLGDWARVAAPDAPGLEPWIAQAQAAVAPSLDAAGVVGSMPNIVANRLNSHFDLKAPGFTVSAEELSGIVALETAVRALRAGEIDAALVGAVDVCAEEVHERAARAVLPADRHPPGDAAVALVLKRADDARREGQRIYALLGETGESPSDDHDVRLTLAGRAVRLAPLLGHAHAASGLLHVAAAALACHHHARPAQDPGPASPWLPGPGPRAAEVLVGALGGAFGRVDVVEDTSSRGAPFRLAPGPRFRVFSGADRHGLLESLARGHESNRGPARLVIVAADEADDRDRLAQARQWLLASGGAPPPGVSFHERPLGGDLAFVFTGPAGAYRGMGGELLLALPDLLAGLTPRLRSAADCAGWIYDPSGPDPGPSEKLWGASLLCQVHAELTRGLLRIEPQAAIGFCSGETNALFALGAWRDMDGLRADIDEAGLYTRELAGEFAAVRRAWKEPGPVRWSSWRLLAPIERVREALAREPRASLSIKNAPGDCVVSGDADACRRVVERVGPERARSLAYDVAVHCPETAQYREEWRRLHRRPTFPVPGVRFYTHATLDHYVPTVEAVADALTGQAMGMVDFPALVEKAWRDGVRVFVEHGPQGGCTHWISRILGDREHLAVALDLAGESPLRQAAHAVAQLVAAGVSVDHEAFSHAATRVAKHVASRPSSRDRETPRVRYPVHSARPLIPPFPSSPPLLSQDPAQVQVMAKAPWLPPVTEEGAEGFLTPEGREAPEQGFLPPPAVPPPLTQLLEQVVAHQRRIAEIHQAFLAQNAALHASFLILQARSPFASEAVAPPRPAISFSREQLEELASGSISSVFGPLFRQQDGYRRQVRMPQPPLLLADRVTAIEAEPGTMGKGTIRTETDVTWDSWHLHEGRMPAGIMIEAGQADLLLISWLGVDFLNRGERVYRLLGCELTYHGGLPRPGDTLRYDIHIDSHAQQGDIRLFFFHYDCRIDGTPRLSVRNGQAGFFTDRELAEAAGVLWDPATAEHRDDGPLDPPRVPRVRERFAGEDVRAFSEGRAFDCFGPGYERALTHVRPPRIAAGRMCLLGEVTHLDPAGGPWRRGYLRSETRIAPDDWFFAGHFKDDPCMPGTLMFEGCLEAMAFYLAALGFTLDKDGWLFEPVPDETYNLRCRGQVTPASQTLVCELFVEEVKASPHPTLYADLLGTVDGLKAFHCRRMGLRLVPDWPLTRRPDLAVAPEAPGTVAEVDGFRFGGASLLACAWGRPSEAFGPMYSGFDGTRRVPRLPGPPYLFVSRIRRLDGPLGKVTPGLSMEAEYDVPAAAWYFEANPHPAMPWSVLLEVALQPCGWLASALGIAASAEEDLFFRNLDGAAAVFREIGPAAGTLRTAVTLKSLSRAGGTAIVSFDVSCFLGAEPVCRIAPVFGFFPRAALAQQVGLPPPEDGRAWAERTSPFRVDLRERPARYCEGELRLPGPMLLMLDRVTGYWPEAGRAGLGRLRAEKDVLPGEWFFKAHFFQDPVQPGSLGLEAMLQLLEFYAIERGLAAGILGPRFSPLAVEGELVWKYRGQVLPENRRVVVEAEILRVERAAAGFVVVADAWLTVDGVFIYSATNLGLRVAGAPPSPEAGEVLDPAVEPWTQDHKPTYVLPTLPMMCMVDRIAAAAQAVRPGGRVVGLEDVEVKRWITFDRGPVRLRTEVREAGERLSVTLLVWRDSGEPHLSRFEPAATGTVRIAATYPPAPKALPPFEGPPADFPYDTLGLGPSFHVGQRLVQADGGATAWLDAAGRGVPHGLLNASLLDGALHAAPRDDLGRWFPDPPGASLADLVCHPSRVREATFHGPPPAVGEIRCEVRPEGLEGDGRSLRFRIQLIGPDGVWAELRTTERLSPRGRVGTAPPEDRRAFLAERAFVPGLGLSRFEGGATRLTLGEVRESDWLPGTVARAYGLEGSPPALVRRIAVMDHVAQRAGVHPSEVEVAEDGASAEVLSLPLTRFPVHAAGDETVTVIDAGPAALDTSRVRAYWREQLGLGRSLVEDLILGLGERYVRRVVLADPAAFQALDGQSAILLANHQVGIESLAASVLLSGLRRQLTVTLAKAEHRESWVGELIARSAAYPGVRDPGLIVFFDRRDDRSLLAIVEQLQGRLRAGTHSLLVHVEGTRALSCSRPPVTRMSSIWLDLAVAADAPIVPVRFRGGLPASDLPARLEFPLAHGRQDYWLGRPIPPEELRDLPFVERSRRVLDAINDLGPPDETPLPPEPAFAAAVDEWVRTTGTDEVRAVFWRILEGVSEASDETRALVEGGRRGRLVLDGRDPRDRWLADFARLVFGPRGPAIALDS